MSIEDAFKKAGMQKSEMPAGKDGARGEASQNRERGFETPGRKPVSVAEAKKVLFEGPRKTFHAGEREVKTYSRYAEDVERNKNKK